ncbi:MAG: FapA family protein, partial [Desulfovibrionaceae bacterium]
MPYHLKCLFDPRVDPQRLRPKQLENGSVDHYDLGFIQNVVAGEVIAELQELPDFDDPPDVDRNFVFTSKSFPAGSNTEVNPADDSQLLAAANGLVCMDESGRINVRKKLALDSDVDFRTGNIFFVGDLVIKGAVRSGFQIRAKNLMVEELIEGAEV